MSPKIIDFCNLETGSRNQIRQTNESKQQLKMHSIGKNAKSHEK